MLKNDEKECDVMFKSRPLPLIETKDVAVLKEHIKKKEPIHIRGMIRDWPALSWSFASLQEKLDDKPVKVLLDLPKSGGVLAGGQEFYEKIVSFRSFVECALDPTQPPCYLGYSKAANLLEGYENNYDFSSLVPSDKQGTDTRLWIGSANTCSGLHTDLKDNIFAQIVGRKRVFLIPANQTHLCYPFIDNIVNSQIDPEHDQESKFPKFAKADLYELVVEPGDILFIPRGWWHYLRSKDPSISINHWFGPPVSFFTYFRYLVRLGPSYLARTFTDMFRYGILKKTYKKEFFFTPQSTGERLFNLIRYGNFSKENDPTIEEA